jgi:hypothetical protein
MENNIYIFNNIYFQNKASHLEIKRMASEYGLKVILEFGLLDGMSAKAFSKVTSTAESRTEFIAQLLLLVDDHQFDGLSLRWHNPGIPYGCPNVSKLHSIDVSTYTFRATHSENV